MGKKKDRAAKTKHADPSAKSTTTASTAGTDASGAKKPQDTGAVVNYAPPKFDQNERNMKIERLDINYHGQHVLKEARLELVQGRRYGLIGPNGCGKSTLMNVLGGGELEMPPKLDYFHLSHEVEATEESALDCVLKVDTERQRLEEEVDDLQGKEDEEGVLERLELIYERLDELEAETAETRASRILFGLGFDAAMQARPCRSYSGGWRMRIALAQVLFLSPSLMLLDEPTNHLDIEAVVWLENYLKKFKGILFMVSHSQDFMNSICTNIIHMFNGRLNYYSGNYDQYVATREEKEEFQMKRHAWEQSQIKSMKDYIARFGHGSKKLARQAQSKEKTLEKMTRGGLTEAVARDTKVNFMFPDTGYLPPPVIKFEDVWFKYPSQEKYLYENVEFGIDLDSHVCLVGPNGAGKTTLQKLITGELEPSKGYVSRNGHCVVARFNQHFVDQLDLSLTPLEYIRKEFPEMEVIETCRAAVGRFGITGSNQTNKMSTLSDGMKSRVVLAWMALRNPHVLLLDEPTNHLDMDSIDALADGLNEFNGAVILVSHDMRLIAQVASEIWVCDNNKCVKFNGDIADYKEVIEERVRAAEAKYETVKPTQNAPRADNKKKNNGGKDAKPKQGKVASIGAPAAKPREPKVYTPPTGKQTLTVTVEKHAGEGIGIGIDGYFHEDLVVVLDTVAPGSIAEKHGLTPLIGSRIAKFNGQVINSEEHAGAMAGELKSAKTVEFVFTALPDA